jgi:hypothetical protein
MTKTFFFTAAALAVLSVSPVYGACSSPGAAPTVPDGSTATADDILKAQQSVVAFNSATTTYLACIKKEHDDAVTAAGPSISSVEADKLDHTESTEHNAAVHQLNDVVNHFNQSVAAYKAKNAPPKKPAAPAAGDKSKSD